MDYLLSFFFYFCRFYEVEMLVNDFLIDNTNLIVRLVIAQALESFFCCYQIGRVELYRIENSIVGYTAFYQIIFFPNLLFFPVCYDKIEPVSSIAVKDEYVIVGLINVLNI